MGFREWRKVEAHKTEVVFASKEAAELGTSFLSPISMFKLHGEGYGSSVMWTVYEYMPPPPPPEIADSAERGMDVDAARGDTTERAPKKARTSDDRERFAAIESEQRAQGAKLATLQEKIDANKEAVDTAAACGGIRHGHGSI